MTRRSNVRLAVLLLLVTSGVACLWGQSAEEFTELNRYFPIEQGTAVADLGAGNGDWSLLIAEAVGTDGRVIATEVDEDLVNDMNSRFSDQANISVVLGEQNRTGLEADCCDAILIRLVYHHFEEPEEILTDIWNALRPEGRVAVIDFTPGNNLPRSNVPEFRGGHGVEPDTVVEEMTAQGFDLIDRVQPWSGETDRFLLVFKRLESRP